MFLMFWIMFLFTFLSGSKPLIKAKRVHVTSKAKKCWNKMFWIVIARVDLTTEIGSSLEEIFFNSSARGKKRRTKPNSFGRKFCAFKRGQEKSWNKNWVLVRKFSTFKSKQKQVEKNTKPFGGKNVLRKKVWVFEWCLVSSQKYTKSFGGKKSCSLQTVFAHQSQSLCLISN